MNTWPASGPHPNAPPAVPGLVRGAAVSPGRAQTQACPAQPSWPLSPVSAQSVVKEMNRLGVIIDLAHVSVATMKATLRLSTAPVIFSHSSAYSLCQHRRNVPDDVLQLVVRGRGLALPPPPSPSLPAVVPERVACSRTHGSPLLPSRTRQAAW